MALKQLNVPIYKTEKPYHHPPLSSELGWIFEIIFLATAGFLFLMGQTPAWKSLIGNLSINFLAVILEALPFMLIGSLAGGLIEVFVPVTLVDRFFGRRHLASILLAGGLGLGIPVCECAIVPVVRRLLGKGIPFAAAITFLLAGPIVNLIVAWSTATAYAYNWTVVGLRMGCGYIVAVTVGLLLGSVFNRRTGIIPGLATDDRNNCGCGIEHGPDDAPLHLRLLHALEHAGKDFFAVGRFLVIGTFIAALMRSSLPMEAFSGLMATPWAAILLMMGMAVGLNLCSEADAFIAASFRGLLPGSAQLAFMVLGPMLDIKLLLMYFSMFRKRVIIALCIVVPLAVFITMLAVERFFPAFV